MKTFINRHQELDFLEKEYNRSSSSLIILYGRRRVGKTTLISEFIKNKKAIYFLATEESETQNIITLKNIICDQTNNQLNNTTNTWDEIFKSWPKNIKLLIIDEFQYLGKVNNAFPSIFQKIWDTILKDKNIMVILCGSLISMMESQTLSYSSPLYGRRTGQIKLKQISFLYYKDFYPNKSYNELIQYYAITGGVPKYIELFYDSTDIYSAIKNNILSKSSYLYDEPNFLLQKEVDEIGSYFSIIKTIATGNQKLTKISTILELKQNIVAKHLKTLIDLDIIEREVPITENNPETSKTSLYKIKDNFILFWFKFIYPYLSYIESGFDNIVFENIKEKLVNKHISYIYEDICIEKMWQLSANNTWDFYIDKTGRWWDNNTEIDIVALDHENNNIIFGECKYWSNKVGLDVLSNLEIKSSKVSWNNQTRKNHYIIFSINGFTDDLINLSTTRKDIVLMS